MSKPIQNGFTLVEILAVILILGILMGITVPVMRSTYSRAKTARVKSDIAKFESAAEMYRDDWGTYPPADQDPAVNQKLYMALRSVSPVTKRPYVVFHSRDISNNQILDSWGVPYRYIYTQSTNSAGVYSNGPNGRFDNYIVDDISRYSR